MSNDSQTPTPLPSTPQETQQRVAREFVGRSSEPTAGDDTRRLLQGRLKLAASALLVLAIAFLLRDAFLGWDTGERGIGFGQLVLLLIAVVVLYRGKRLSLESLRIIELAVFAMPAFRIAYLSYWSILEKAQARDAAMVLSEMQGTTLSFVILITFYGMFVPNSVRRASIIIGSFGVVFMMLLPAMSFHDPAAWQFIWNSDTVNIEHRSSMALIVIFAVGISITASSIIHSLRSEVIEARQLGQYRLTESIGKGGMGEVWKAEHALLARPAAVKLIRPEVLDPKDMDKAESMIRRFEREAQNTANLSSVHTVELYDFGITDSGTFYFVMELLDGIDLETMVNRSGALPPARVRYLVRQVCDSLQEAHAKGLVHRDVKPANILACRMGASVDFIKVLDFGLAKHREPGTDEQDAKLTREGMVIGTPAYMPPETVTRGVSDARSDIYALGCVMYWLLTGELVFEGSHAMSMVVRHAQEAAPAPSQRSTLDIPAGMDRIVLACLEKDPEARPQSAAEVRRMLDECELQDTWTEADAQEWWTTRD